MCFPPTVWFKPPWELLYKRSRTPETLKAVQVALVKPVAYLLSYRQVIKEARKILESYCKAVCSAVDDYFEELIQSIGAIANQLKSAEGKLANATNYLNRAYAKRIVDWATDQPETLTDTAINKKILKVNRVFGSSLDIQTTTALSLTKSQEEICTVLQECVSIQHTKN